MSRVRVSTTVDAELLQQARAIRGTGTDSSLIEEALRSFLAAHNRAAIDATYEAYDQQPLNQKDTWGDVESWSQAAKRS